jgi:hypothetical protein
MRDRCARLLSMLCAACVLAAATGSASAGRISFSNTGLRTVFTTFGAFEPEDPIEVRCKVTLEGSIHTRTTSKVINQLIGYITRAIAEQGECVGGSLWMLNGTEVLGVLTVSNTLPWHMRYESFTGNLPIITGINVSITGLAFLTETIMVKCLYLTEASHPARATLRRESGGLLTALVMEAGASIPKHNGEILCAPSVFLRGTSGQPTLPGRPEGITTTLVV